MNIFGIGALEIIFVLIIGILVLGPQGMINAGKKLGKFLRSIIRSDWWQNVRRGISEIQYLPQRLMREAELDELNKDLNEIRKISTESFPSIGGEDLINKSSWSGNPPSPETKETDSDPGNPD